MNGSKVLVTSLLQGTDTPRFAVGPLAVHYCAYRTGVSMERYTLDPQVLADCVVRYYEAFHPDAVWISADTWVSAEAMGAAVPFRAAINRWPARASPPSGAWTMSPPFLSPIPIGTDAGR